MGLGILLLWFGLVAALRQTDAIGWALFIGGAIVTWLVALRARHRQRLWVGHDWLRTSMAWGDRWVRTDQLTELKLDWHGDFTMRDRDGRKVLVQAEALRSEPEVSRIFTAAVRRSLAHGLRPDREARRELGLDRA